APAASPVSDGTKISTTTYTTLSFSTKIVGALSLLMQTLSNQSIQNVTNHQRIRTC
uniref:Uncharacterized protein n=1 Tax=Oryza brachyantha TaxID=4533 RepID=J3MKQ9_ORYBR